MGIMESPVGYHVTNDRCGGIGSGPCRLDLVGWIVAGLLTSATAELILPGRNPAWVGVALLLGAAGFLLARFVVGLLRGVEATQFGVEAIICTALGAFTVVTLYRIGTSLRPR
jgi:uncharacterized membrane protein YeaQ/YmgE (transglycosylase-associated protein family)